MEKKKIVVLTGAGISAESGLKTFRDSDGLWNGFKVEEVATPRAFAKNPQMVLDFYNERRKDVAKAEPNAAHFALAALETWYDVVIITQNIDDLHERAGSTKVAHLHGEIFKMRSTKNEQLIYACKKDIQLGDLATDGAQLRPYIVWFEEPVPMIDFAAQQMQLADIFILVGTSLQVYPAAGLINDVPLEAPKYIVDKVIPEVGRYKNLIKLEGPATEGMQTVLDLLKQQASV